MLMAEATRVLARDGERSFEVQSNAAVTSRISTINWDKMDYYDS